MPTKTSITKDGITWTFSQAVPAGQFVNGDYYVVGPVTVTSVSPAPTTVAPYLNGSIKNPPTADGKSALDSRLNDGTDESFWFNAADQATLPVSLMPGDALVSSRSIVSDQCDNSQCHVLPGVLNAATKSSSPVASVSVLTVLSSPPEASAFRPSYWTETRRFISRII